MRITRAHRSLQQAVALRTHEHGLRREDNVNPVVSPPYANAPSTLSKRWSNDCAAKMTPWYVTRGSLFRAFARMQVVEKNWSGREDLNLRPPGPEPGALPG